MLGTRQGLRIWKAPLPYFPFLPLPSVRGALSETPLSDWRMSPPMQKEKMPLFLYLSPNFIIQGSWDDRKKGKWCHIKEASLTGSSLLSGSRSHVTPLSPLGPINFPKSHCRSLTIAPVPTFFFPTKKAFSPSQLSFCELPEQMDSLITVYGFSC